jgi:hypothetical protein
MIRIAKGVVLALPALLLSACQSPTTSSTSSSTSINVTTTNSPPLANAQPSHGVTYTVPQNNAPDQVREFPWKTIFTVMLKNNDTVGMNVTSVTLKVQQAIAGIVVPSTTSDVEHYQFTFTPESGSKRLDASGTSALDFNVWYALPNGGIEALVTIGITFTNDNNISDSRTVTEQVLP